MTNGGTYPEYKETGLKWLGQVPASWGVVPLWTLYSRGKSTDFPDEELLSVYRDHGVVPKSSRGDNFNKPSEDLGAYQLVKPGDMVINKMKAWQGSVAISRHRGIVSPAYFVYERHHGMDDRYLHYLLRSERYITGYLSLSKGIRINQWDLDPTYHSRMPVLVPSLQEQRAIVDLLDRETAQIDELIGKQERLIELLAEKRQAIITHAVTKGLEPNTPTKPSGIPWLGEIPAHWTPSQLGTWLVQKIEGGYSPTASSIFPEEENWGVLSLGAVGRGEFLPENVKAVDPSADVPRSLEIRHGDLLLTRSNVRERVGFAAVVKRPRPRTIFPDLVYRLALNSSIDTQYLVCFLSSSPARAQIESSARGSSGTMPKISHDQIRAWRIPLPPLSEQKEIADFVRSECGRIDKVTVGASAVIGLLRERRSALISAAVTGKIDVREGAAQS